MHLVTLEGSDAARLKGPLVSSDGDLAEKSDSLGGELPDAAAAAAIKSRPDDPV